jgi:signal transduction histidine kinase
LARQRKWLQAQTRWLKAARERRELFDHSRLLASRSSGDADHDPVDLAALHDAVRDMLIAAARANRMLDELRASIALDVADRGAGVPSQAWDRIFESFVSTKPDGLGLSICRNIVRAHHGRIWVTNNPDRGATFHVSVPPHARGNAA